MKNSVIVMLVLAMSLFVVSCGDDAPSMASVALKMKASTTQSTIKSGRVTGTGVVFKEVMLGVVELEFETLEEDLEEDEHGEDDNDEVEFEGRFVVDLVKGTSTPDFGIATLPPGLYEEIEVELAPILPGNKSVFVALSMAQTGADSLHIEFSSADSLKLEIERDGGFMLDGSLNKYLVMLELDVLFQGIDFSSASKDSDGIIRINKGSNASLYTAIVHQLKESFHCGKDNDDDGEIDD